MEFMELIQGDKTIFQYKVKFTELAQFAPHIVNNDERKTKKFQRELCSSIKTWMTTLRLRTFSEVLETTKVVERECEDLQRIRDQGKKHPN